MIKVDTMLKIDCHTHIVSPEIRDEYFCRTDNYALVMQFPESIMSNVHCLETVHSDRRLFLCPCIDLREPVSDQLHAIEPLLESHRVVGLKIYLSYQRGRADEPKLFPVYEFAAKHRLAVTFHTGLCSLVLPSDQDLEGSSSKYIARAAKLYSDVNFVAAHMDDPHFRECMAVVTAADNIYTDISGAYETGTKEGNDVEGAITTFKAATDLYPDCYTKILYGTDFCPPISLSQLDEYDYSIEKMFAPEHFDDIYYKNALRAFPRLREYINI